MSRAPVSLYRSGVACWTISHGAAGLWPGRRGRSSPTTGASTSASLGTTTCSGTAMTSPSTSKDSRAEWPRRPVWSSTPPSERAYEVSPGGVRPRPRSRSTSGAWRRRLAGQGRGRRRGCGDGGDRQVDRLRGRRRSGGLHRAGGHRIDTERLADVLDVVRCARPLLTRCVRHQAFAIGGVPPFGHDLRSSSTSPCSSTTRLGRRRRPHSLFCVNPRKLAECVNARVVAVGEQPPTRTPVQRAAGILYSGRKTAATALRPCGHGPSLNGDVIPAIETIWVLVAADPRRS